ncbi:hypothetical protein B0T18DRAFT_79202 [Schizothecium vesticola]|uniref:UBC core domain-containing protein n=1 Tax=Schizothecium vesticola TaxID=314040 RepID=A0AA40F641_9PEZI|nr:hypothetical protein B0T18DRAFT_79202 [Schizothecium vesticola]
MHCPRQLKTVDLQQMKSVTGRPDQKIAWCCDAGRQFLILAVACGPRPTTDGKTRSDSKAPKGGEKALLQPTGKKASKSKGHASSHVSKLSQGTGYGGASSAGSMHHVWAHGAASVAKITATPKKPVLSKADRELEMYLFALSKLLPSQPLGGAAPSFDHRSHTRTAEILAKTPLLRRASEVLRRSSVEDMGYQHQLYFSLLQFLVGISRHTDLRPVLFHPQTLYPESQQVAAVAFGSGGGTLHPSLAVYDTTQSLDGLLQELAKFCRHFVGHAQRYPGELEDTDEARPLSVAEAVIAAVDELQFSRTMAASVASMDRASTKYPVPGPLPNVLTRSRAAKMATTDGDDQEGKLMAAWHREHCVEEVADETIMNGFSFAAEAQALKGQASEKGRMKSLVVQMASLSADLPQGIYVRHGVSRLDVIKALIVGPKGTPYENGIFEFDMFCDSKFPSRPPHMMFRTTGGGTVEFNPNLYVNGKVCLSLLGTWAGQSWEPHRSTILQILVSIQGMIFNPAPWYNEPGREYNLDDQRSKTYSQVIWGNTLRHATVYWLKCRLSASQSSSKGKNPAQDVSPATKVAAPAAASATRAPAKPTTAADIQPLWNTQKLPDAMMHWDTDGSHDITGASFQHTVPSSSKSVPLPQTMPFWQAPKVSQPAASYANQAGASYTSAFDHPPLTAKLHPDQVPPGVPPLSHFSNFSMSAQWMQLNTPQKLGEPLGNSTYMDYLQADDALQMYQNQLQALNTSQLPFSSHIYNPPRPPMESAVAPDHDDVLWGETLRTHFSVMATKIVDTAVASPYGTDQLILSQVKHALRAHKFI